LSRKRLMGLGREGKRKAINMLIYSLKIVKKNKLALLSEKNKVFKITWKPQFSKFNIL
jgi:hypothetical protein